MRVENKRHTNAHQPLTYRSPVGATIPPSPPDLTNPAKTNDSCTSQGFVTWIATFFRDFCRCSVLSRGSEQGQSPK
jgi:hypothetical protein